jgi:diadenosine tetraphosphate (Ap4A) HIT family hydrolase
MGGGCLVCDELEGRIDVPGGLVWSAQDAVGFHMPPLPERGAPAPYLGHLLVVVRRHVAGVGDLTDAEAAAVGVATTRLAAVLAAAAGAVRVHTAVVGTGTPHFHQHLLPRYADTPADVPWHAVDEWEGARRGGAAQIAELADRLRAALQA